MSNVSKRALIERINRRLDRQNQRLCKSRGGIVSQYPGGWRNRQPVRGRYGVVDLRASLIVRDLPEEEDLERFGRELGALRSGEQLQR